MGRQVLKKRIIPVQLLIENRLVKTIKFDKYIDADPVLTLDRGLDTTGGLGGVGTGGVGTGGVGTGGTGTNVPGTPIVPEGITAAASAPQSKLILPSISTAVTDGRVGALGRLNLLS